MESVNYAPFEQQALVKSMCTLLLNKAKVILLNPQKNRQLAANQHLLNLIELVAEHLIPQYCAANMQNSLKLNLMHNLCFLLAQKLQSVFTSGVIKTCIDQNWDLKGYRSVLLRILLELGVEDTKKVQEFFETFLHWNFEIVKKY